MEWGYMNNRLAAKPCLFALLAAAACGVCHAQAPAGHTGGIWKAAVPPTPMKGEFDSLDPLGLAAGASIKADCSLNWVNPDDGRLYCFSSGTSLEYFLDKPRLNIERAKSGWLKLTGGQK
jgi:hypothetical protein